MKNKKTAFEQYIEEFNKIMKISNNLSFEARFSALHDLKEKTKKMEKEQSINDFISGMEFIAVDPNRYKEDAEQYYNKTYRNNK